MQDAFHASRFEDSIGSASRHSHFACPMAAPVGNLSFEGRNSRIEGSESNIFSRRIARESMWRTRTGQSDPCGSP